MPSSVDELTSLGFRPLTEWLMRGQKVKAANKWKDASGWLYAFVVNTDVRYIGMTERILVSRIDDYSYIKSSQTVHKRQLVMSELVAGNRVWIYGLQVPDAEVLKIEELRLRKLFNPPWNRI